MNILQFKIDQKKCKITKNLENNKKLRNFFTDYRFKKEPVLMKSKKEYLIFLKKIFQKEAYIIKFMKDF